MTTAQATTTKSVTLSCHELLTPLQKIIGVVEKRQTLPILSNVLIQISEQQLSITGTDLEVELIGRQALSEPTTDMEFTVSAKKLFDICKSLSEETSLTLKLQSKSLIIVTDSGKFTLLTLPTADFPTTENDKIAAKFDILQASLKNLIQKTSFAMAQQDVRYYLNGLLVEIDKNSIATVATDGHRLAFCQDNLLTDNTFSSKFILPRKGILELMKLLDSDDSIITIAIAKNHFKAVTPNFSFTSKLLEGQYPDYKAVIPSNNNKTATVEKDTLRKALQRVAILSNEQFRGILLNFSDNKLQITANNMAKETAEDSVQIDFSSEPLEICFNVGYLLDALSAINSEQVTINLSNSNSSIIIESEDDTENGLYVVMPMKL